MIRYLVAENPDDRVLKEAADKLTSGGLVAVPTETNWVVVCSPDSKKGIDALHKLIGEEREKHLSIIARNISEASHFALIHDTAYKIVKRVLPGPITFLFSSSKHLPRSIRSYRKDGKVGVRIPSVVCVQKLLEICDTPLLARAVMPDMLSGVELFSQNFHIHSYQIEEGLGHLLALILDPGHEEFPGPSTLIDFSEQTPVLLREGIGSI